MNQMAKQFARLLTQAIRAIAAYEHKSIQVIQDELGLKLGKTGGASIERWRKGYTPAKITDIEMLTRELIQYSAGHPYPEMLLEQLIREGKRATGQQLLAQKVDQPVVLSVPYIAGPPIITPNMFFGRQPDLGKVISLLNSNFVMLTGPRRIGKTSLLYQLAYHLELNLTSKKSIPVLINVEGISENEFFHLIMEEILSTVNKHLSLEISSDLSFDLSNINYSSRDFSRDLQIILKNLENTSPLPSELILLMDEMDTINGYSLETQSQLRRIFQRFTNRNLSIVVASVNLQQHWAGESSPFYNMFVPVRLSPFTTSEARRLITQPVKGIYNYDDEAISRILEATLCLPNRIQQLCLEIVHSLAATQTSHKQITVEDVDKVLQNIQWTDEEATHQGKVATLYVDSPLSVVNEEKSSYQATKTGPEDLEINQ
jgi:hypothetical protein